MRPLKAPLFSTKPLTAQLPWQQGADGGQEPSALPQEWGSRGILLKVTHSQINFQKYVSWDNFQLDTAQEKIEFKQICFEF